MIASTFFCEASSRTTIGISNAPGTRCREMVAPGESVPSSSVAWSIRPCTYGALNWLATMVNVRFPSATGERGGMRFDIVECFNAFSHHWGLGNILDNIAVLDNA